METSYYWEALAALLFVLALLAGLTFVLKKMGIVSTRSIRNLPKEIQFLESTMLDPKHRVVRFQDRSQEYVVLLSGNHGPLLLEKRPSQPLEPEDA